MIDYNLNEAIDILKRTPKILESMLSGMADDWVNQNEGEGTWSPILIVAHLIHGEKTDWVTRTRIALQSGERKFVAFDMDAHFEIVKGKSIDQLLKEFKSLRSMSLKDIEELNITEDQLLHVSLHPELGDVTLKNHLSAWVVHDLGHIAQISRVLAKHYTHEVGPWVEYMAVLRDRPKPSFK